MFPVKNEFSEAARISVLEMHFKLCVRIDIGMLLNKLDINPTIMETWIVSLISSTHFEAKVDSNLSKVFKKTKNHVLLEQILKTINFLADKTYALNYMISGTKIREV